MDKGTIILVASIVLIIAAIASFFSLGFSIAVPLGITGIIGLICMKLFYKVVEPNEAHVRMFQNKKEVFIARPGKKLSYFELPIIMQVMILPLSVFKTEVANYVFQDRNFAPFKATVVPYFVINEPEMASERISQFKELNDQLEKIVLSVSRSTMLKYTIREIMSDRQKISGLIEEEIKNKLQEFGVFLKNFELVDILDSDNSHVIQDLNKAEQARIESDSRKLQAEKLSEARVIEAERDQTAKKREIERDREVGIAGQLRDQEISKQQQTAITQAKLAKQIETVRQKEIDKQAAQLEGEALAIRKQSEFEGIKQARILEADGEASYLSQTGKARGEALAAEGQGKAMGILKEAEAMQKYDNIGQAIKKLVVEQAIQTAYADALKQAEIKAYLTGKPEGGIMGLLSPQGGASLGTALATFKDTKQESNGLMDLLGNIGIDKKTVEDFITGLKGEPKEEKKTNKKGGE